MEYTTFGRTGLRVSVAGLGGGGASRLGLLTGSTVDEAVRVVERARELGITYFDTAEAYGTEQVMGRGLEGHRDEVVISSKIGPRRSDGSLIDRIGLRDSLETSLRNLRTETLDVYHLHRPSHDDYNYCVHELVPELENLRVEGKIKSIGITGMAAPDPQHTMLQRAVADDCFDVLMTSFNLFNQSARDRLFPSTIKQQIAVEVMLAAKGPFSRPVELAESICQLIDDGMLDPDEIDRSNPLGFLEPESDPKTIADTSYRFARHELGVDVVLVGTGNIAHLEQDVDSLNAPSLPETLRNKLVRIFGQLSVGST